MNSKYNEIIAFLRGLGIENMTKSEKKALFAKLNEKNDLNELKMELELLFAINKSLISSYGKICVSNMMDLYKSLDTTMMVNLFFLYQELKDKGYGEMETFRRFKGLVLKILGDTQTVDEEIGHSLSESFRKSLVLKDSLYLTMHDKEKADALFNSCIRRSKLFLKQCDARNLESIIFCLKKDFNLSDDELVSISKKCASFFSSSSTSKINNLYKQIEAFKSYIKGQSSVMSTAIEIDKLLKKEFKEILFDASSVATINSDSINKTVRFLMGEKFGKVRGDFTPYQLAKIYNESISSLSISVEKIEEVCESICDAYKMVYKKDLDLIKLVNGHNFSSISQLTKEDYSDNKKIGEIFEILSMFISEEDMENLLKNNFSFLVAPVSAVKKSLQEAVLLSSNKDELRMNVLKKIRNHFDIYEGQHVDIERTKKTQVESLNKVGVRNIDEEEIRAVLEKLETDSSDIESWEKRWNKEEKEYRNLQIELELEDLLGEISSIEDFLRIDFVDVEQYLQELMTVKDLYMEVCSKYDSILEGKRLNKSLLSLSDRCSAKLNVLRDDINSKLDSIISTYREELAEMNKNLLSCIIGLSKVEKKVEKMSELDALISEKGISKEENRKLEELAKEIRLFFSEVESSVKTINARERKANSMANQYFMFLKNRRMNEMISGRALSSVDSNLLSEEYMDKFSSFIYCLEYEGLIDGAEKAVGRPFKGERISYKQYRSKLSKEELAFTDEVYRLFKENMIEKEAMKDILKERLKKYGLKEFEGATSSNRLEIINEYVTGLEEKLKENILLLNRKSRFDENAIKKEIESLKREKEELEKRIEEYSRKVEVLIKEQIKR